MIRAVENYLAARHAAGFELKTECYLLFSFARFAAARGEMHIRTSTAIDWASRTVSVAQRDARLKAVCRFARYMCAEDSRHELPPSVAGSPSCGSRCRKSVIGLADCQSGSSNVPSSFGARSTRTASALCPAARVFAFWADACPHLPMTG